MFIELHDRGIDKAVSVNITLIGSFIERKDGEEKFTALYTSSEERRKISEWCLSVKETYEEVKQKLIRVGWMVPDAIDEDQ